ncbi:M15 family metallopeptidase, partial [Floricoccus penangensis]
RAIRRMISDMQNRGYNVSNSYSGYRSYGVQSQLYQSYVNRDGRYLADTYSARPGHSEHQTGLVFDLINWNGALIESNNEATWIAQNAHKYGFIVRYPRGKEYITGYQYEPWHLRYVGNKATSIYNSGKSLEEYYGILGGGY